MKEIQYAIWQEGKFYVSKCLNNDVSSFGDTVEEAKANLMEALELYFEEDTEFDFTPINNILYGSEFVNA
jgi:predicted RNase H-like HicB family nuclease